MQDALSGIFQRSLVISLTAFCLTLGVIAVLGPIARTLGWVDKPGGRKTHPAPTPFIGGLAIAIGSLPLALSTFELTGHVLGLLLGGAIVLAAGVLDDIKTIRWGWRLLAQASAALAMIVVGGVRIETLGPLFGGHAILLGAAALPFTLIATIGVMNAINMSDGVDGLAGGLCAAALLMLASAAVYSGNLRLAHGAILLVGALMAFLSFNLRTPWNPRATVFLGNAGSEFLGLVIVWCCIRLTQNDAHPVAPALAPFLLAPPLIDCLVVVANRLRRRQSPFAADRNHLHHILLDAGWPTTATIIAITLTSIALGLAAALAISVHVSSGWLVIAFVALTLGYYVVSRKRDRCVASFRELAILIGLIHGKAREIGVADPHGPWLRRRH